MIEDTRELQFPPAMGVSLCATAALTMRDCLRYALRLAPDRIAVGEVRGGEAYELMKAWNTGHPGGITTVHANSPRAALYRLEQLVQEAVMTVPRRLIAEAINLVVFIKGRGTGRQINLLAEIKGIGPDGDYVLELPPTLPRRSEHT